MTDVAFGLPPKEFEKLFSRVYAQERKARSGAARTLTPGRLRSKNSQDLVRLGKRADGTPFTAEDLARFQDERRKHTASRRAAERGVTASEVFSASSTQRVARANNRAGDSRDVKSLLMTGMRPPNQVMFQVQASEDGRANGNNIHRVVLQFEELQAELDLAAPGKRGLQTAVKRALAGRVSIECSCQDHKYRYRYMATVGNYAIKPLENAFPKITNPNLQGLACKHVLLALNKVQSITLQRQLATKLERDMRKVGYADDKKRSRVFSAKELESQKRNRKGAIDQDKARAEHKRYLKAHRKLKARQLADGDLVKELRRRLKQEQGRTRKLRQKAADATKKANQQRREELKLQLNTFIDAFRMAGGTKGDAVKAFGKKMSLSDAQVERLLQAAK